jgi:uncharacterized protein (DUF305 family)
MRRLLAGRALFLLAAVALVVTGYALAVSRSAPSAPDERSADVGFVRDMSVHHAQAVTLAKLATQRATVPAVRHMAEDIMLSQQREIGVMAGWMQQWHLPITTNAPAMTWMEHPHIASGPDSDPPMPGMATRQEVAIFAVTRGPEADLMFCRLMLDHHLGGLHMISEVIRRGSRPEVVALARQMQVDQQREITQLSKLLTPGRITTELRPDEGLPQSSPP